ncbi:MAG TPA: DUF721 domain-containing protein [Thiotrichales bacterium]|nr:DUF721 domain-containing protein [Thiotrichales bacterium]
MANRPQPLGNLLNASGGIHRLLEQARAQQALLGRVRALLPAPLDRHCVAALERKGQLLLYTDSPAWSSRLRFHSRALERRLRADGLPVGRIRVRVSLPDRPRGDSPPPVSGPGRTLSRENAALIRTVAGGIRDHGLRAALERLAGRERN